MTDPLRPRSPPAGRLAWLLALLAGLLLAGCASPPPPVAPRLALGQALPPRDEERGTALAHSRQRVQNLLFQLLPASHC